MAEIHLQHLTKQFPGGLIAVNDLELVIPDGSFVALLGPSGCGKTTTMNLISGLERPTRGEVYFDGQAISRLDPGKRNVGFVFQNYAIFTHMTVYENLSFGLRMKKKEARPAPEDLDREVRRVAEVVGLSGALERRAGRLSVNDLQKVALGRSMIVRPAIFLMDEPFSNLDAAFRAYMRAELKGIQRDIGQTMVYVTHDQVEAMSMADRVAVMSYGVLQQYASPDELYNRPANRFVANFIGSILNNFLPCVYERVAGRATVQVIGGEGAPIDITERDSTVGQYVDSGGRLTASIRPELVRLVAPDAPETFLRAKISLVEPLGAKDVVHLTYNGFDVRAVGVPGQRPTVGDSVGLAFDHRRIHIFDDETGRALY
jgi:multiple sugar transport system ATP-binding protein